MAVIEIPPESVAEAVAELFHVQVRLFEETGEDAESAWVGVFRFPDGQEVTEQAITPDELAAAFVLMVGDYRNGRLAENWAVKTSEKPKAVARESARR